jgi:hypothetical protein
LSGGSYYGPDGDKVSPSGETPNRGISFLRALDIVRSLCFA